MTVVEVAPVPSACRMTAVEDIHVLFVWEFPWKFALPTPHQASLPHDCVKIGFASGFLYNVL
jgi:hypothetical protein